MKKCTSFILATLLLVSMLVIAPFGVAAVELDDSKIYIKVDNKHYEVEEGDIFTYEYTLTYTDNKIGSLDMRIPYDDDGLRLIPYVDEYGDVDKVRHFPSTKDATVYNFNLEGELRLNYSSIDGIRFMTEGKKVFVGEFEVITDTPGVYEINAYFETLADVNLVKIVYLHEDLREYSASKYIADMIPVEEQPTDDTSSETIPPTVEPSEGWTGSGPSEPLPVDPSDDVTDEPTEEVTSEPTEEATDAPTEEPTEEPTEIPTLEPTEDEIIPTGPEGTAPTEDTQPTQEETEEPTVDNTDEPTEQVTEEPTEEPTDEPTVEETQAPTTLPEGYYLVGTLRGESLWDVDNLVLNRKLTQSVDDESEYYLDWTFTAQDEIKVVYFDGMQITQWFNSDGENYKFDFGTEKDVVCKVRFNPNGNEAWAYNYILVEYDEPVEDPTDEPTVEPTDEPTEELTEEPTDEPTDEPTEEATDAPTEEPTEEPTVDDPTDEPTEAPTDEPTDDPTEAPTDEPTDDPTEDPEVPPVDAPLMGDVNGDGEISIFDATTIQRFLAEFLQLSEEQQKVADVNGDGEIDIFDATKIQRFLSQVIEEL